jgi:hypothetical protein
MASSDRFVAVGEEEMERLMSIKILHVFDHLASVTKLRVIGHLVSVTKLHA